VAAEARGVSDVSHFDRLSAVYDWFAPTPSVDALRAGFEYAHRPVTSVLDVAGGTGRTAASLAEFDVTVVDASAGMLREAESKGLPVVRGDATRLPVVDAAVDAVTVTDALHHVSDARAAVAEAARVVRPGGVLVVREFDPAGLRGRALVAAEHAVGFELRFFEPGELADAFVEVGLRPHVVESGFEYALVGLRRDEPVPR